VAATGRVRAAEACAALAEQRLAELQRQAPAGDGGQQQVTGAEEQERPSRCCEPARQEKNINKKRRRKCSKLGSFQP
jgi:hypothetical protein